MTSNHRESESDLDRSSWEGMGGPEISNETASFIFSVRDKFLKDINLLDLEDATIGMIATMDEVGKEKAIKALKELNNIGIRGCLEKLISTDELLKIDKEETRRLIDLLMYDGSTPG